MHFSQNPYFVHLFFPAVHSAVFDDILQLHITGVSTIRHVFAEQCYYVNDGVSCIKPAKQNLNVENSRSLVTSPNTGSLCCSLQT